jgi:hypothetical protein
MLQTARQARMGRNIVKSSSPNSTNTDSSAIVTVPTLYRRTCFCSSSSFLAVGIRCRVSIEFVFRKNLNTIKMAPKCKNGDGGTKPKCMICRNVFLLVRK